MYESELNIDRLRQLAIDGAILLGLVALLAVEVSL